MKEIDFTPLITRTVCLVNGVTGEKSEFAFSVSIPYRPPHTQPTSGAAACLVKRFGLPVFAEDEVVGFDEFEALQNAIESVNALLKGMIATGRVEWPDGVPFDLLGRDDYTRAFRAISGA